jgi:hypothetical protein
MLAAADHLFDPTLPGLFVGDPPAEFVPLLAAMAADVRPDSMSTGLLVIPEADQRDLLPRIAVPTLSFLEVPELFSDAVREFCRAHPPHTA